MQCSGFEAMGASFTLGEGNQMVCKAADFIVQKLEGVSVAELMAVTRVFTSRSLTRCNYAGYLLMREFRLWLQDWS